MTALGVTYPEPAGDIRAQLVALTDLAHPKRALWVSAGGSIASIRFRPCIGISCAGFAAGRLYAGASLCRALRADPSLETLSAILDYHEPKHLVVSSELPVVQALNPEGWVIQEMISSWSRVGEARRRAAEYGCVRVVSMVDCLARRERLIAAERMAASASFPSGEARSTFSRGEAA